MNVGVVFCGRQSSGGHNVVAGLFDYLHAMNPTSKLLGFIGGTSGLFEGSCIEVTEETLRFFASFDMPIYDLLGQSEGTAPISTCSPVGQRWKIGTVSPALSAVFSAVLDSSGSLYLRRSS